MSESYWAIVPAAGIGQRMGSEIPKQYLDLLGRRVIDHTLQRLLSHPLIDKAYVALSETDTYWPQTEHASDARVVRVSGGHERCHSVLNALRAIGLQADADDWVLVHDAARPCIAKPDLNRLIETLQHHAVGGLLGVPVQDTLKLATDDKHVVQTVQRSGLWQAYTPQMFRLGLLTESLEQAIELGQLVTDDASAIELAGYSPVMVEGHGGNIKITRPADLQLAAFYLSQNPT
ncbi:MAG: 2-C-methyl-D-erythritol 4-phosphate cytidylyltransferase [Candidatus Thiodiazotropha sp. (ex Monitilora ramsayi)]|nr:2-C-methyl-D-erythritol 4-phosphate cytidylyltransferase [Candidatus Thiodiazotropha sp. (ex Monitilora ramsayi)]